MGGTSTTSQKQSQTSQLAPYDPANPALQGILGGVTRQVGDAGINPTQTGAINTLESNAAAGNTYAPLIGKGAVGLLNGGGATANDNGIAQNLTNYKGLLDSTANGSRVGANSALKPQLDQIATDVGNSVNSSFAAAGRDGSPGNTQALARGVAAGQAPVIAAQYNQDEANRLGAAGSLYGAGNSTYGMLNANNAAANSNITAGAPMASTALAANNYAPNATLEAEAQRFGIPTSQYATLLGMVSPVAAQFGLNSGTGQSDGTSTMSGAQQFGMIANGIGALMPKNPISFGAR